MEERERDMQLQREGLARTFVRQDGPNAHYPDHTHAAETAHIILSGEMTLTMNGRTETYRTGDRCEVPAGAGQAAPAAAGGAVSAVRCGDG